MVALFILLGISLVVVSVLIFAGNYFVNYVMVRQKINKPHKGAENEHGVRDNHTALGKAATAVKESEIYSGNKWVNATEALELNIMSYDGLNLSARLFMQAQKDTSDYAIVIHGHRTSSSGMYSYAKHFYDMGYNVLLPDCRSHGMSEGKYIGMGWLDRKDMLRWIDRIIFKDRAARIVLYGISMGGATVMMTSGELLPENVKAGIEDCGYSDVWVELADRSKAQFGLPQFPLMHVTSLFSRIRAGYWFREASCVNQLKNSNIPMMFIHGEKDDFVPYSCLAECYSAKSGEKEILSIPGAGHVESIYYSPEIYWDSVGNFLKKYVS